MTHKTRVSPPYVLARAHTLSLVRSRSSSPPPTLPLSHCLSRPPPHQQDRLDEAQATFDQAKVIMGSTASRT